MSDFRRGQIRKFLLTIIFLQVIGLLLNATPKIDSLKYILKQPGIHDTILINVTLSLSEELKTKYPVQALDYSRKALSLAENLELKLKTAEVLSQTGNIYSLLSNFEFALDFYLEARQIYTQLNDLTGQAASLYNIGKLFSENGHLEKALEYYYRALPITVQTASTLRQAELHHQIAVVYYNKGEFAKALSYSMKSLEICGQIPDNTLTGYIYQNLGLIYQRHLNTEKSEEFFKKALAIGKARSDTNQITNAFLRLGYLSYDNNLPKEANEYYLQALRLFALTGDNTGIAQTYFYIAKVAVANNDLYHAVIYYKKSLEFATREAFQSLIATTYLELAHLKMRLGNPTRAYMYLNRHIYMNDSLNAKNLSHKIAQVHIISDRELKEHKLEVMQANLQSQFLSLENYNIIRNFLIAGAVLILVLLFLLYNRFLMARNSNLLLEKQKEEITAANQRLMELNKTLIEQKLSYEELNRKLNESNQKLVESEKHLIETNATKDKFFSIISHDLRNPFASIVSFSRILKRDIESLSPDELKELAVELDKSVLKINNLLENLLKWSRAQTGKIRYKPEYISVNEIIKEIINLFENNAKSKDILITDEVDEYIAVWADKDMTETILRNLLSNALKYTPEGGKVRITSKIENQMAYISVIDNGVGMTEAAMKKIFRSDVLYSTYGTADEKGSGIGLLLCKEFAEKQGGGITFESQPGKGSIFTVCMPLQPIT